MAEKDWQNADLIFDIDAKDLHLPCRINHTIKKCTTCGSAYGNTEACPDCKATKFETASVLCNDCMAGAKKEVGKLAAILTGDLGIKKENIIIYYSGNERFHIHVSSSEYEKLDSKFD